MAVKLDVKCVRYSLCLRDAAVCLSLAAGKATTKDIAKRTGYNARTVQRALSALRARRILRTEIWYEGSGKRAIWYPVSWTEFRRKVIKAARRVVAEQTTRSENVVASRQRRRVVS